MGWVLRATRNRFLTFSLSVSSAQTQHQMQSRLLLDVVIGEGAPILELLTRKDQTLLLGRNALLILDLGFHILDRIVGLDIQSDGLSRQRLHEDLHRATAQTQHQMQRGLLLNVIVGEGASILELLSREDQSLLLRRDALLILDLGLHVLNGVIRLHVERNRFARQSFDEDLHRTAAKTQDEVQRRLLLNVVIGEGAPILELFARENETLLLGRDSFLILDLGLHVLNGVVGLHVQSDRLSRQRFDENLHRTAAQTQHQMQRRLLLDVIVRQRTAVLELFARENQALLLGRNT